MSRRLSSGLLVFALSAPRSRDDVIAARVVAPDGERWLWKAVFDVDHRGAADGPASVGIRHDRRVAK